MTDDRELLEKAAKAAGIPVLAHLQDPNVDSLRVFGGHWNPLTDVGDAARLLLALRLRVDYVGDQPCIDGVLCHGMTAEESFCRAVVRAAAALADSQVPP